MQYVSHLDAQSASADVTSGVIQGSVIGLQMFKIYVNDPPACVKSCKTWLFADDSKFVGGASRADQCQLTQSDLDAVHSWSLAKQMPLLLPKCQCLHPGRKNINHVFSLGAAAVSVVNQYTDLGLLRTSDFFYTELISSVVDNALRCSGMLLRAFSLRQRAFMLKLFITYVRPIVEYASSVWNPTLIGLRSEVENVQRRFTKKNALLTTFFIRRALQAPSPGNTGALQKPG